MAAEQFGVGELKPRYVLGDAHSGIDAGASVVFPEATRLTCWWHVKKNFRESGHWDKVPNKAAEKIRALKELDQLQLAPSSDVFFSAAGILLEQWRERGYGSLCGYFKDWYLTRHALW